MSNSQKLCHDPNGGLPRLLEIMARLRNPETGCPWDIEQTYKSIAPYTIEEAYEVADAIDNQDWSELEGELGDLLLQVVYYTQMGSEDGYFTFDTVVKNIADKMVHRHPHVSATKVAINPAHSKSQIGKKSKRPNVRKNPTYQLEHWTGSQATCPRLPARLNCKNAPHASDLTGPISEPSPTKSLKR